MDNDIKSLNEKVKDKNSHVMDILKEVGQVIVGQRNLVESLIMGVLADGHILLEGVPGLAKTLSVKTLSDVIDASFQRIQFTPDLLPSDLVGTLVYNPKEGDFSVKKGPVFHNFILADEINRSPAKVQSALLESMQERQVTIGDETFKLPEPFLVLATQNPIEQEGTYPLPEAQVDRFMFKVKIDYPTDIEELEIVNRMMGGEIPKVKKVINIKKIIELREVVNSIYVDEKIKSYVISIVFATREPEKYKLNDIKDLIAYGASPRASIYLIRAAKAHAFLRGRGYVVPEDIKMIGMDILRHRIIPTYEAEAENVTSEDIIKKVFDEIEVP
ncbi:AAA family ATPase [bacterium]|nr:AAA family ATPase [bacterium]